jgi:orotidine-5'-phosphate decarboxylase
MSESGLSTLDIPARERLIVALDVETIEEAFTLVERLGDAVEFYKVGWELILSAGSRGGYVELIRALKTHYNKRVMADLKLHEIPETVSRALRQLHPYNVDFVTFHAQEIEAIKAAVAENRERDTKVLAVTVLTSMDVRDLKLQGIDNKTVEEVVLHRAAESLDLGVDGVIASGRELEGLRTKFGYENFVIATPGIRDEDSAPDDQKRRMTIEQAFLKGADFVVVGRPITRDDEPREAALKYQARIAALPWP